MQKVIVFGDGQSAEMNYSYLTHDSPYDVVAFTVDRKYIRTGSLFGLPVIPFEEIDTTYPPDVYKMSILTSYRNVNKLRAEKYYAAKTKGYELINYMSSKAVTWPNVEIGDNCFFYENCSIGPFTKIGNNVSIGPGSVVGHHCVIKDHCFVAPHATVLGSTTVGAFCLIGANSTIRDGGINIASECVIGAGALITKDTREKGVYVGRQAELMPKASNEMSSLLTWGMK